MYKIALLPLKYGGSYCHDKELNHETHNTSTMETQAPASTTKKCSVCQLIKDVSEFSPRKDRPSGLYSCCKPCKCIKRHNATQRDRLTNPIDLWIKRTYQWTKSRAQTKHVEFNLTMEFLQELIIKSDLKCSYCLKQLNFQRQYEDRWDAPSIDRIIPSLGYTQSNSLICCYRCNAIKNDATSDELYMLSEAVKHWTQIRQLPKL